MPDELPTSARPRVAAGALFFNDAGEVLLVKPTYKDGWDIPGGYVEPGETPIEACEREIREELGWELQLSELLAVDWAPSDREGDKLLFVFDGGTPTGAMLDSIQLPPDELGDWAFHPVSEFASLMPDRLVRRLRMAAEAHGASSPVYLEHGDRI